MNLNLDVIFRNIVWIILSILALLLLNPSQAEFRTLLFILLIEATALGLSALAVNVYTKIDFIREQPNQLGLIFLGVHLCAGFVVMGVYFAQFSF